MKLKNNPWRTATILLGLAAIVLLVLTINNDKEVVYEFGDFTITESNFNALSQAMTKYNQFPICDIKQNKCIYISRADPLE